MSARRFTFAGDVWSFGVFAWEVHTLGKTPWKKLPTREVVQAIGEGKRLAQPKTCPDDVYGLMMNCWAAEPSDRPSFSLLCPRVQRLHQAAAADLVPPRDIGALLARVERSDLQPVGEGGEEIPRDELRWARGCPCPCLAGISQHMPACVISVCVHGLARIVRWL